jgi:hypothetical protein
MKNTPIIGQIVIHNDSEMHAKVIDIGEHTRPPLLTLIFCDEDGKILSYSVPFYATEDMLSESTTSNEG